MRRTARFLAMVSALAVLAPRALSAEPEGYTPDQQRMLALRAAQVDGLAQLAAMVLGARVSAVKTVGQALGPGSESEIALRVFLRSARAAGEPRVYSDGVAEVDVELPFERVVRKVNELYQVGERETGALADLRHRAVDGFLRATGCGRAPPGVAPADLEPLALVPPENLPEMYPAGWEHVAPTGRVLAIRDARARAHRAMDRRLREILLGQTATVGDLVRGASASEALFGGFVRSRPVVGAPRMMPDRLAEVTVAAEVRDLIRVLKDIRRLRGDEAPWSDEQIDRISVRLKTERIATTGRGMPPPDHVYPAETSPVAGGAPLPDWAAGVLEAQGKARFSEDPVERDEARVLAARSAKALAQTDLVRKVNEVTFADGTTVRQRAAKDAAFRGDLATFLSSARTALSRPSEDGEGWEVGLRLPLLRLYEFSLPRK